MKTMKTIFSVVILGSLLFGCSNDIEISRKQNEIMVENGRLVFATEQTFLSTLERIQSGSISIENGKIPGVEYKSFFETISQSDRLSSEINSLLDIRGFQILLNENKEFKIADRIIHIEKDVTTVSSKTTGLVSYPNEVRVLDKESKIYVEKRSNSVNARGLNQRSYYNVGGFSYPYANVSDIYTSVSSRFLWYVKYLYHYDARIEAPIPYTPPTIEYWRLRSAGAQIQKANYNIPVYTYNRQSIQYYLGESSASYSSSPGVGYFLQMEIKMNPGGSLFTYTSQFFQ